MNEVDFKTRFGKRIKELRTQKGFTQEELAEMIEIGERNLSKIECGNNFVKADTISKLAKALSVNPYELFKFRHTKDKYEIKSTLLNGITNETIDIELLYKLYEAIKS